MALPTPTYFTCTLGEATNLPDASSSKPYSTIPQFLAHQASQHPDLPALGIYHPVPKASQQSPSQQWPTKVLTFARIHRRVLATATRLRGILGPQIWARRAENGVPEKPVVALLWPSGAEFLFLWLGLMQLGCKVLLVAPQCGVGQVVGLCEAEEVGARAVLVGLGDGGNGMEGELRRFVGRRERCNDGSRQGGLRVLGRADLEIEGRLGLEGDEEAKWDVDGEVKECEGCEEDVAYLHHTSGTSSGMPKPIPQTHHGGLVVLPRLDGRDIATFTTTPLYHGGVADLFRAWTSNAMMWLFPGADMPITATNVNRCLAASESTFQAGRSPRTGYFSSVPYVLQMLAADEDGLTHLTRMDIVGVGGAALPGEAGDELVRQGFNLVSRYGSAECGFLLSSHRDYGRDGNWQYLRLAPDVKKLHFEPRDEGLYELIVGKNWPHMAKRNREDGGYATSDLFERHHSIENAWRYHSRADSQLTLITGKKFDPAPLEASIAASSSRISDALIFGEGQAYPGVLLFRGDGAAQILDKQIVEELKPVIQKLNDESQAHARIPQEMLVPMPPTDIEKSSKGTVLRRMANERFAKEIEQAYAGSDTSLISIADEDLTSKILQAVSTITGTQRPDLTADTDLFSQGIDSVAAIQIRSKLSQMLPPKAPKLPMSIVQDCGTVANLSNYILALRHGRKPDLNAATNQASIHEQMLSLVEEYSRPFAQPFPLSLDETDTLGTPKTIRKPSQRRPQPREGHTVLLTGATGSLGAHLLSHLLSLPSRSSASHPLVKHIYLLIRPSPSPSCETAQNRVLAALSTRSLPIPTDFDAKVTVLSANLAVPGLGLDEETYGRLTSEVTHVFHLAWEVNFLVGLQGFRGCLAGVRGLLGLCEGAARGETRVGFTFCSSTASVVGRGELVKEELGGQMLRPEESGKTGYARSKWVGERVCVGAFVERMRRKVADYESQNGAEHGNRKGGVHVHVVRVGQLSGSTVTGCWSRSEAYPLMLSASRVLGVVPDLDEARRRQESDGEECAWVPVDVAARAFVDLLPGDEDSKGDGEGAVSVLHLLPRPVERHARWRDVVGGILEADAGAFRMVGVGSWLDQLETLRGNAFDDTDEGREREKVGKGKTRKEHPALQLADFWRDAYCSVPQTTGNTHDSRPATEQKTNTDASALNGQAEKQTGNSAELTATSGFEMTQSLQSMPALKIRPAAVHLDEGYLAKCWDWIKENV